MSRRPKALVVSALTPRKKSRVSHTVRFLAVAVILAGTFVATAYYAVTSPRFQIEYVQVRGLERIPPDEVLAPISTCTGQSLFTLDVATIRQSTENHVLVRKARVLRQLPSSVVVVVEERQAYALVESGKNLLQVDRDGVVLGHATEWVNQQGLCCVQGIDPIKEIDTLRVALAILDAASCMDICCTGLVHQEGPEGFALKVEPEIRVILGAHPNLDSLAYLPVVLQDLRDHGEDASIVDLRFSHQIAVTLSGS